MTRKHFGTDGVRGTVGQSPMTPDFVLRLGYAAGKVLSGDEMRGQDKHPAVLIGKDTRISGYMIEAALEAGFSAAGVDVLLCGPLPTPGVAYLTRALRLSAGVVISASHNPYPDNGIKFFSGDGFKLPDRTESAIEAEMDRPMGCNEAAKLGRARRVDDAGGRYVEFCKSTFPAELDLKGMKIAVDCAHGAAYNIAPHVFHELGADVAAIGVKPDGFNINDAFGAASPKNLIEEVRSQKADLGITLDGTGDPALIVDSAGRSYPGAQLLLAVAGTASRRRRRHAHDQLRLREGHGAPWHRLRARQGRRPLRARADAREGLAAGRREFGAHHLPRQAHHRRRHRLGLAGAARDARVRTLPGRAHRRARHVSAGARERERAARL
jgi:phosphoglucosamine mutase